MQYSFLHLHVAPLGHIALTFESTMFFFLLTVPEGLHELYSKKPF